MNTLRRVFWLVLAIALALTAPLPIMNQLSYLCAASGTVVKVEPYESYAPANDTFVINVTIIDVQNLYGVEIALYWNASVLDTVNVDVRLGESDGVLYVPIFIAVNNVTEGKYLLSATSTSGTPFSGSGNAVRITFKVIVVAESPLDLESKLYDYPPPEREPRISWPIEHMSIDGIVVSEFSDIMILMLFLFMTVFVVFYAKNRSQTKFISRAKIYVGRRLNI